MLDDLSAGYAEDVYNGSAAILRGVDRVNMQPDEIAVDRATNNSRMRFGIPLEPLGQNFDENGPACWKVRIVLDIPLGHHVLGCLQVVLVEDEIIKTDHESPIAFCFRNVSPRRGRDIALCQRWHAAAQHD